MRIGIMSKPNKIYVIKIIVIKQLVSHFLSHRYQHSLNPELNNIREITLHSDSDEDLSVPSSVLSAAAHFQIPATTTTHQP